MISFPGRIPVKTWSILLVLPVVVAGAGTLLGLVPGLPWPLNLAAHFQVQYGVVWVVTAVILSIRRRWWWGLLLGLPLAVNMAALWPYLALTGTAAATPAPVYRALFLNIYHHNDSAHHIAPLIRQADADIVAFVEMTPDIETALAAALTAYPYRQFVSIPGYHARAIYSRLPLGPLGRMVIPDRERPSAALQVWAGDRPLTVIATHLNSPIREGNDDVRARERAGVAAFVTHQPGAVLLLGDFNDTPWHPEFAAFLADTGLRNGRVGLGLHPTWPTSLPPLMLPIDHALATPDIVVHHLETAVAPGSDHRAILVDFSLLPPGN